MRLNHMTDCTRSPDGVSSSGINKEIDFAKYCLLRNKYWVLRNKVAETFGSIKKACAMRLHDRFEISVAQGGHD